MDVVLGFAVMLAFGEPSAEGPAVSARGSVEWLSAARGLAVADTALNPGNLTLRLPQLGAQTELRPNLRLECGGMLTGIVRPRLFAIVERDELGGRWQRARGTAEVEWTEAYLTWNLSEVVSLSYGLQNFQWGPAELASPSNRLFH